MDIRSGSLSAVLSAACALAFWSAPACGASEPATSVDLEQRLAGTRTLVESSSAAQQVRAGGVREALEQQARARDLLAQAQDAWLARQPQAASALLDQAARAMFTAVRLNARPGEFGAGALQAKVGAASALLEAHSRIVQEKRRTGQEADVLARQVASLLAQAEAQARAGDTQQATQTADAAYRVIKAAVGQLRDGDTLVRELRFATPADEYAYELDRNEAHRMLALTFARERVAASSQPMVDASLARAADLRLQAQTQAGRGEHAAAIRTLERSTRELIRGLREAGVYIPG